MELDDEEMFIESYEWYINNRENILSSKNEGSHSHHQSKVKQGVLNLVKWII